MVKNLLFTLFILFSLEAYCKESNKAVFIIVDGVPADVIEKVLPPTIDSISKVGGYSRGYTGGEIGTVTETPTISAVGYNNILTATWANKHNVWDNEIKAPNYNYPSIFWVAKHCLNNSKIGVFSGWEENLTKLVGDDAVGTGMLHVDYFFHDSDKNTKRYPESDEMRIFKLDQDVTDEACKCIVENGPDVTWVYLWYMDDAGHRYGTGELFENNLLMVDRQVSQIWNAVKARKEKTGENWLTIVTSDHGRTQIDNGKHHGGQSDRERSVWVAMDHVGNSYFNSDSLVSLTDISPTICNFIKMKVPSKIAREWEGVPMIGKIDFSNFKAVKENNIIKFSWKGYSKSDLTIRVCASNYVKDGEVEGRDKWYVIGKRDASEESYQWDCKNLPSESGFYKFSIEGPNTIESSAWISYR